MKIFFVLLLFSFLIFSCLDEEKVSVQVENQYSEKILNCQLGENSFGDIEKDEKIEIIFLALGEYNFSCQIKSGFEFSAKVKLNTKNQFVLLRLNQKGKVEIVEWVLIKYTNN